MINCISQNKSESKIYIKVFLPEPKLFEDFNPARSYAFMPQYMAGVQPRVKTSKSLGSELKIKEKLPQSDR